MAEISENPHEFLRLVNLDISEMGLRKNLGKQKPWRNGEAWEFTAISEIVLQIKRSIELGKNLAYFAKI